MAWLEVTTRIGSRNQCVYCPQDKIVKAYSERSNNFEMSFEIFQKCIDKVPDNVNIHFSGLSEPWLNPKCTEMVLYAYKKNHGIQIYTTLVGMKELDIDKLKSISIIKFAVHLPSLNNDTKIKVDKEYVNIIKKITQSKINNLKFVIFGKVHPEIKEIVTDFNNKKPLGRAGNIKDMNIEKSDICKGRITCSRSGNLLNGNILLPNGDVILCCNDYGMKHVLGNLANSSYELLFTGKEFTRVKSGLLDENIDILCRYCEYAIKFNMKKHIARKLFPKIIYNRLQKYL